MGKILPPTERIMDFALPLPSNLLITAYLLGDDYG